MQGCRKHILNLFIILAVIAAGISPACKFISGQSTWMEICGVDGIKKILVAFDDAPAQENKSHASADPCAFCLTHSSVKTITAKTVEIKPSLENSSLPVYMASASGFSSRYKLTTSPRGPPKIL